MKKIKDKPSKPTTAAKTSSPKIYKSRSKESLAEKNTSSMLQSKRAAMRSPQSESEVATDITSHKRIEIALQESEEAFRTFAESVPQIVWATQGLRMEHPFSASVSGLAT